MNELALFAGAGQRPGAAVRRHGIPGTDRMIDLTFELLFVVGVVALILIARGFK